MTDGGPAETPPPAAPPSPALPPPVVPAAPPSPAPAPPPGYPVPPPVPPPPQYPVYGYSAGGPPVLVRSNSRAIGALVCGLIALFVPVLFSIPAIILGHTGRRAIREGDGRERGVGMATTGIVLGWLTLVIGGAIVAGALLGDDDQAARGRDAVVATVAPACRGDGVAEAGVYRGIGPFHLVVVGDRGRPIAWSDREARWRAESVADTELVACVAQQANLIETCPYIGGADIDRYEAVVRVRVVTARSGRQVNSFRLTDEPRPCQYSELVSTVRLDGDVPFREVSRRLAEIAERPAGGSS